MAKHTMVSYYGMNYVEHAERDFQEMKEHGCDTVLLALTEFDLDFWFPNIDNIIIPNGITQKRHNNNRHRSQQHSFHSNSFNWFVVSMSNGPDHAKTVFS